ncbi:MAG TPA: hypothetical protein VLX58_05330 [Bryobacteraceae bacterium]|nr:hypothetical protein [Bryobacteraceae bacterium]
MKWTRNLSLALLAILVTADLAPAQFRRMGRTRRARVERAASGSKTSVQTKGQSGNGQFTKDKTITGPNGKQTTVDTTGSTTKQN